MKKKIVIVVVILLSLIFACVVGSVITSTPQMMEDAVVETTPILEIVATLEPLLAIPTPAPRPTNTPYPTPAPRDPRISDFELELIIIEEKCFGSAGCLITVRPDLTVLTTTLAGEWLLIYEIHGVDNGSQTYNLELHLDKGQYSFDDELLSTPGGSGTLTWEIIKVISN